MAEKRALCKYEPGSVNADKKKKNKKRKTKANDDDDSCIALIVANTDRSFHIHVPVARAGFVDYDGYNIDSSDTFDGKPIIYTHTIKSLLELSSYMQAVQQLNDYLLVIGKPLVNGKTHSNSEKPLCDSYDLIPALIDILKGLGALDLFNDTYKPISDKARKHDQCEQTKFWRKHIYIVSVAFFNNKVNIEELFDDDVHKIHVFSSDLVKYMQNFATPDGLLTTLYVSPDGRLRLGELISSDYTSAKYKHPHPDYSKAHMGLSVEYFKNLGLVTDVYHTMPRPETYILMQAIGEIVDYYCSSAKDWKDHKIAGEVDKIGTVQVNGRSHDAFNWEGLVGYKVANVFDNIHLVKLLPCANCDHNEAHRLAHNYAVCGGCYDQIVYNN